MSKKIRMQRIAVIIAIVTATVILPVAAQAQTKDDFEYWDLNRNSDLTCTEASGKDEGLKLPAYRDNRAGTGLIYEWLQRQKSSDTDNDGIACDSTSNPNGFTCPEPVRPHLHPRTRESVQPGHRRGWTCKSSLSTPMSELQSPGALRGLRRIHARI